jgi:hypothetical protein
MSVAKCGEQRPNPCLHNVQSIHDRSRLRADGWATATLSGGHTCTPGSMENRGVVAGKRRRVEVGRWPELAPAGRPFSNRASRCRLSGSNLNLNEPHPCRPRHVSSSAQPGHSTLSQSFQIATLPDQTSPDRIHGRLHFRSQHAE